MKIRIFMDNMNKISSIILQIGLAFVFIYFGIDKIVKPDLWMGFVPIWIKDIIPFSLEAFMIINGIFEILIGILVLFKNSMKGAALLMSLFLLFVIFSLGLNTLTVRDTGLLAGALALVFWKE